MTNKDLDEALKECGLKSSPIERDGETGCMVPMKTKDGADSILALFQLMHDGVILSVSAWPLMSLPEKYHGEAVVQCDEWNSKYPWLKVYTTKQEDGNIGVTISAYSFLDTISYDKGLMIICMLGKWRDFIQEFAATYFSTFRKYVED